MIDFSTLCGIAVVAALAYYAVMFVVGDADNATFLGRENAEYYRDKVIWVTGASSGIGMQFCRHVSALHVGAKLVISARTESKLRELAADLKKADGTSVAVVVCDLAQLDQLPRVHDEAKKAFGRIDMLVNNAGMSIRALAHESTMSLEHEVMNVDYFSYIQLAKLVVPGMAQRNWGHIVNVASLAGIVATPMRSSYSGAKFALLGYFNCMRLELHAKDIDIAVTNVCPGAVRTSISLNRRLADGSSAGFEDQGIAKGMTVERCCQLMSIAVSNRIDETWIMKRLLEKFAVYSRQYLPSLHFALMKRQSGKIIRELTTPAKQ